MPHPQRKFEHLLVQYVAPLLALVVCVCYIWFLSAHAMNVPLGDDVLDVLKVVTGAVEADGAAAAFNVMFEQHNDHRTLASRLAYCLVYLIQGKVDFITLTFVANFGLLILAMLLFLEIKDHKNRWLIFLPVVLILFQPRAFGILWWPTAAFAYFYVYVYGFAALFLLQSYTRWRFLIAVVCATMCTFSLASGQVIWLVGLASLVHQSRVQKRPSITYIVLWVGAAALALMVYRINLDSPNTIFAMLQSAWATPLHHTGYFLALLGSAVGFGNLYVAQLFGGLLLMLLCWLTLRNIHSDYSRCEYACWFVVLTVAAMTLGRAQYTAIEYSLESRYSFPSMLLFSSVWITLASRLRIDNVRQPLFACLLAAAYCLASYKVYPAALQPYIEKRVERFNQGSYWVFGHPIKSTNAIVEDGITKGIYQPPPRPLAMPTIE